MRRGNSLVTLGVATACATLGVMPVFLVGALAVLIRQDMAFNASQLGLVIAAFFAASATFSVPGGALSDRMGPRRSLLLSVSGSVVVLVGLASLTQRWTHLLMLLFAAGAVNGLAQPAANLVLAARISAHRQGFAFGIKQSAVPGATLLAGISVPVVSANLGWQSAFWGGVLLAVGLLVLTALYIRETAAPRAAAGARLDAAPSPSRIALVLIAVGGGLGVGAATCLGAFLVDSTVERGISIQTAGLLLSLGSAVGVTGRLLVGWLADKHGGDQLIRVSVMLAVGAVGFGLVSVVGPPSVLVIGTVLAFGAGWGWAGIYVYALVLLHPRAPGKASGIAQVGAASGAMLGPAAFGAIVERSSYTAGWISAATAASLAAALLLLSARLTPPARPQIHDVTQLRTEDRSRALACGHTMNGDAG